MLQDSLFPGSLFAVSAAALSQLSTPQHERGQAADSREAIRANRMQKSHASAEQRDFYRDIKDHCPVFLEPFDQSATKLVGYLPGGAEKYRL